MQLDVSSQKLTLTFQAYTKRFDLASLDTAKRCGTRSIGALPRNGNRGCYHG